MSSAGAAAAERGAAPGAPDRLRIDELAQRSRIASGTIRFYQREGLISPPERSGRVAYYCAEHLRRLERIKVFQAKGLPLAVIGDLLEREDAGEDVASWLALDSAVFSRPGESDAAEDLAALLAEAGMSAKAIEKGSEVIVARLREIARAMAELGWDAFAADRERIEADEPVAEEVRARLEHMRSLALRTVQALFAPLLDEAIRERSEPFARETVAKRRRRR